jgi:hypothetical protein
MIGIARALCVLLLPGVALGQLPSTECDLAQTPFQACNYLVGNSTPDANPFPAGSHTHSATLTLSTNSSDSAPANAGESFLPSGSHKKEGFHWQRALLESFMFLSIEQAYVVHDDYKWVVVENGVPLNHFWRDYKQSLHSWLESGWNDGDALMYGYVGHPIQGALTSYIQIQNDPRGDSLEFSNTRAYWHSRLRATIWNTVYSTQWNIGPFSEMTVEKYGAKVRSPWNQDGTWPCTSKHCYTGVGQIDLVMTPVGGFVWTVGEDWLDKQIAVPVEEVTRNHFLIDFTRCAVNPIRGGASILHGRRPWWRARDARQLYFQHQAKKLARALPTEHTAPAR